MGDTSRMSRETHVRICEGLGVKFPGPTRQFPGATHRVITCHSEAEAHAAIAAALRILRELGVQLHPQKTRVVHVQRGFEFLGYLVRRGKQLQLPPGKIVTGAKSGGLYAYPREKSIQRFKDRVRQLTRRCVPLETKELIEQLNPVLRGWGHYYKRAHVRTLFNKLDHWIERRIWS